jgi:hypothetical protein
MLVVWAALIGAKTFGKNLGKVPIEWLLMSLFLVVTWSSSSQLIHGMKVGSLVASLGVLFDYGKHHFIRRWTGITWPSHYQTWKNNVNYVTLLYIPWESDTYIIYICLYTYKYTYLYITHVYTHIYIYTHYVYIYISYPIKFHENHSSRWFFPLKKATDVGSLSTLAKEAEEQIGLGSLWKFLVIFRQREGVGWTAFWRARAGVSWVDLDECLVNVC